MDQKWHDAKTRFQKLLCIEKAYKNGLADWADNKMIWVHQHRKDFDILDWINNCKTACIIPARTVKFLFTDQVKGCHSICYKSVRDKVFVSDWEVDKSPNMCQITWERDDIHSNWVIESFQYPKEGVNIICPHFNPPDNYPVLKCVQQVPACVILKVN